MAFSLNIPKHVWRHIRYKLRTPRELAWLESLLSPLSYTIDNINTYRLEKLKELDYNGTTIQLERVLNDNFDNSLRRIYILNDQIFNEVDWLTVEAQEPDFDFIIGETSHGTFGTAGLLADEGYLYFIGENPFSLEGTAGTSGDVFDFEVIVPSELSSFEQQIIGYVQKYKLAGKRFKIVYAF